MGFASISGEQDAPPLQKSGRILIFTLLRRKKSLKCFTWTLEKNISVASAVPHGGDLLHVHSFLVVEVV